MGRASSDLPHRRPKLRPLLTGYFKGSSDVVGKIERRARLTEVILRQLIIVRDGKSYEAIVDQRARAAERAANRERERQEEEAQADRED